MADPEQITAWQRLGPELTTSGALSEGDVGVLAGLGVAHVINLALDSHPQALAGEAGLLAARGIGYTHLPIPFDAPGDDHYAAFKAAVESAPRPLHVHCIMNWRVSACFYRWHREHGMAEAEARALMARQWQPETSTHADAPAWAKFITG